MRISENCNTRFADYSQRQRGKIADRKTVVSSRATTVSASDNVLQFNTTDHNAQVGRRTWAEQFPHAHPQK